jgi:GNAT superfamily N-acetyltransferase
VTGTTTTLVGATVRPRNDEDLPACVCALEAVHGSDRYPMCWPTDPAKWLSPNGCAAAWVAEDPAAGSVVGHVCVVRGVDDPVVASLTGVTSDRLASVSRLFVLPGARGRGLARALLGEVSSWASAQDLRLMLDVVEDGGHAVGLYERLGWRLVDRRQADWVAPRGNRVPVRIYLAPQESPLALQPRFPPQL